MHQRHSSSGVLECTLGEIASVHMGRPAWGVQQRGRVQSYLIEYAGLKAAYATAETHWRMAVPWVVACWNALLGKWPA